MNEALREKQRIQSEGLTIHTRDITEVQVRIPQCCRDGGVIMDSSGRVVGPCPHVAQKIKLRKGNVGL